MELFLFSFFLLLILSLIFVAIYTRNPIFTIICMVICIITGSMLWESGITYEVGTNATMSETNKSMIYIPLKEDISSEFTKVLSLFSFAVALSLIFRFMVNKNE